MGLILRHKDIAAGKDVKSTDDIWERPFLEVENPKGECGADLVRKLEPPRVMKTHLPPELYKDLFVRHPKVKVVQTVRNPKDTLVSYFHHYSDAKGMGPFVGTWDQFFEFAFSGKSAYGDLFEITTEWYKFNKDRENSLIIKYEDMKKDHRGHVIKIAKFMGFDLSDKVIDTIVHKTSKNEMREDMNQFYAQLFPSAQRQLEGEKRKFQFVRKGIVGDWTNYFSKEQSEFVDAKCKEFFEPLGLTFEYSG